MELAGQPAHRIHRALAPGQLACLLRGFASGGGVDHLADDRAAMRRVFLQPFGQLVGHQAFEWLAHFGGDELVLGLAAEFGIGQLDGDNRGQPLAHVVARQRDFFLFQQPGLVGIIVERAGQGRAKRRQMGAAVTLRDVVGEAQDVFVIAVIPFERDVDRHIVARAVDGNRLRHQRDLVAVEIFDEGGDAALIIELDGLHVFMPGITQEQPHARIQERQFAIAMFELVEIKFGDLERRGRGEKGNLRALFGRGADNLQRGDRIAKGKTHVMFLPVAPDGEVEPFAQRIDHRHANAVQAARYLIGIVVRRVFKLSARVQLGHDDFGSRHAFLGMDAGRDAAAIIFDRDRPIGVQRNVDPVAMPGQRLVNRIVRYLEHHVVQARSVVGVADIHAGAFAHCIKALEHLDRICAIVVGIGVTCHSEDIGICPPIGKQNGRRANSARGLLHTRTGECSGCYISSAIFCSICYAIARIRSNRYIVSSKCEAHATSLRSLMDPSNSQPFTPKLGAMIILILWGAALWGVGVLGLRWVASFDALTGLGQISVYIAIVIGTIPLIPLTLRIAGLPRAATVPAVAIVSMTALLIDGIVIGYQPWVYSTDPAVARACAGALLWAVGVALALGFLMQPRKR